MHAVSELVQDLKDEAINSQNEPKFTMEGVDNAEDNVHYEQPQEELFLFNQLINLRNSMSTRDVQNGDQEWVTDYLSAVFAESDPSFAFHQKQDF